MEAHSRGRRRAPPPPRLNLRLIVGENREVETKDALLEEPVPTLIETTSTRMTPTRTAHASTQYKSTSIYQSATLLTTEPPHSVVITSVIGTTRPPTPTVTITHSFLFINSAEAPKTVTMNNSYTSTTVQSNTSTMAPETGVTASDGSTASSSSISRASAVSTGSITSGPGLTLIGLVGSLAGLSLLGTVSFILFRRWKRKKIPTGNADEEKLREK